MHLPTINLSSWSYLILSINLEVLGTTFMKMTAVSSRRFSLVLMLFFYYISIHFLLMAVKKLDVGVAYTIWSGVVTALIAAVGICFLRSQQVHSKPYQLG